MTTADSANNPFVFPPSSALSIPTRRSHHESNLEDSRSHYESSLEDSPEWLESTSAHQFPSDLQNAFLTPRTHQNLLQTRRPPQVTPNKTFINNTAMPVCIYSHPSPLACSNSGMSTEFRPVNLFKCWLLRISTTMPSFATKFTKTFSSTTYA